MYSQVEQAEDMASDQGSEGGWETASDDEGDEETAAAAAAVSEDSGAAPMAEDAADGGVQPCKMDNFAQQPELMEKLPLMVLVHTK